MSKLAMKELQEKITVLINDSKGDDTRTSDYRIGLHQALSLIDFEAEKQQIIEVWKAGDVYGHNNYDDDYDEEGKAEQYYNQTYKSDE